MGNQTSASASFLKVTVRVFDPSKNKYSGFIEENDYKLTFSMLPGDKKISDLLKLINAFREDKIEHILNEKGEVYDTSSTLYPQHTVYV